MAVALPMVEGSAVAVAESAVVEPAAVVEPGAAVAAAAAMAVPAAESVEAAEAREPGAAGMDAGVRVVQRGVCSIPNGASTASCPLNAAAADRSKTFLVFQGTSAELTPSNVTVTCQLKDPPKAIDCIRVGTMGEVTIAWQAVELPEARVVHATSPCSDAGTNPWSLPITPPVDSQRSFVIKSAYQFGSAFDPDDFVTAELADAGDRVLLTIGTGHPGCPALIVPQVQVVEVSGAAVARGSYTFSSGELAAFVPTVDAGPSFVLVSTQSDAGFTDGCGRIVRAQTVAGGINFTRGTGCDVLGTTAHWERVTVPPGWKVRQFPVALATSVLSATIDAGTVDPKKTFVFSSTQFTSGQGGGEQDFGAGLKLSSALSTFILDGGLVHIERRSADVRAQFTVFVVELP